MYIKVYSTLAVYVCICVGGPNDGVVGVWVCVCMKVVGGVGVCVECVLRMVYVNEEQGVFV